MNDPTRSNYYGKVLIKPSMMAPKWPQTCLVCNSPCSETSSLRSYIKTPFAVISTIGADGNSKPDGLELKLGRKFTVPVHAQCKRALLHPEPIWSILAGIGLIALAAYSGYVVARPGLSTQMPMAVLSGAFGLLLYRVIASIKFRSPLKIIDFNPGDNVPACELRFTNAEYADKFVDLNNDLVMPWPKR